MDVMRQGHAFLPQNVRQKNVDDMRRKTSIYVRTFWGTDVLRCYSAAFARKSRNFAWRF
jgi:hypothetical protein